MLIGYYCDVIAHYCHSISYSTNLYYILHMIKLHNITQTFSDKPLFENLSLEIDTGKKVLLSAPSGFGKTTLLKMIPGFVQPTEGTVAIDSIPLSVESAYSIRERISYISQVIPLPNCKLIEFVADIFAYKVNRHISYSLSDIKDDFIAWGLAEKLLSENASSLSGGEKQRLALIIALKLNRKILLLDEVTSALDMELKKKVVDTVASLDTTVVVISHDPQWKEHDAFTVLDLMEVTHG